MTINFKKIIGNKFYITLLVFGVWMVFFDANSIIEQFQISQKNREMRQAIEYYRKKIEEDTRNLNLLRTDPEVLEKFAREKYFMRRDNEDIFILEIED